MSGDRLRPGDIVEIDRRGFRWIARVERVEGGALDTVPLVPAVTWRRLTLRDVRRRLSRPRARARGVASRTEARAILANYHLTEEVKI